MFSFQWVPGVNQPGHEVDHWHLSNVKMCVAVRSLPLYGLMTCTGVSLLLLEFQKKCVCAYCRGFL